MNKKEIMDKLNDWTTEVEQIQRGNIIHAKQLQELILQMQDVNEKLKELI